VGVLAVVAIDALGRIVAAARTSRVIAHISVDRWARRHGW
jgi:hypothetical protein